MNTLNEETLIKNPATSSWLKQQIEITKGRDPVDAVNDAKILVKILEIRIRDIEQQHSYLLHISSKKTLRKDSNL